MPRISTYIFLDLETTGFPWQENNQTKVTELSMVAVHREHLLNSDGYTPRVLPKLVVYFEPRRFIKSKVSEVTGLNNQLLSCHKPFSPKSAELMINFIECQEQPACFVVHNGNNFDYPILRAEIDNQRKSLPETLLCIDSLKMFKDILKNDVEKPQIKITSIGEHLIDDDFINEDDLNMISEVENQYLNIMVNPYLSSPIKDDKANVSTVKSTTKRKSYKLKDIYYRLYDTYPRELHRAEADCMTLLECCHARSVEFINWAETHCIKFCDIRKMESGVLLTALLWGGTNPLIRIASKNVSTVKLNLTSIFKNLHLIIKYIIPFSLNQFGSVVYVFMLQKSELSFVVPITNSLTLVFTVLVGWLLGEDRPNKVTLTGMLCIILGTTICWLDKSS